METDLAYDVLADYSLQEIPFYEAPTPAAAAGVNFYSETHGHQQQLLPLSGQEQQHQHQQQRRNLFHGSHRSGAAHDLSINTILAGKMHLMNTGGGAANTGPGGMINLTGTAHHSASLALSQQTQPHNHQQPSGMALVPSGTPSAHSGSLALPGGSSLARPKKLKKSVSFLPTFVQSCDGDNGPVQLKQEPPDDGPVRNIQKVPSLSDLSDPEASLDVPTQMPPLTPGTNKKLTEVLYASFASWEKEVQTFKITKDPRQWTAEHVLIWLNWSIKEFSLEGVNKEPFQKMSGRDIVGLGREGFLAIAPPFTGDILWEHLETLQKDCEKALLEHGPVLDGSYNVGSGCGPTAGGVGVNELNEYNSALQRLSGQQQSEFGRGNASNGNSVSNNSSNTPASTSNSATTTPGTTTPNSSSTTNTTSNHTSGSAGGGGGGGSGGGGKCLDKFFIHAGNI